MTKYTLNSKIDDVDEIFAYEDTNEERLANMDNKSIIHYRTKTIKSGNILECEIYPIWNTRSSMARVRRMRGSRETQKRLNHKNAVKNVIRLANTNFTDKDIWGTFTYETSKLPTSIEQAQKEFAKFIRRLRYYVEKHNYSPLKYIYVTEFGDDEKKGKHRVHHHIVLNFPDRDIAEQLWRNGARRQTRRLQADESGYEGLVRYIMKDPCGNKKYVTSKNLSKPQITVADYKFTARKVNKIVRGKIDATSVIEKMYANKYKTTNIYAKTSDYVSGTYIYAKLTLKAPPKNTRRKNEIHREYAKIEHKENRR